MRDRPRETAARGRALPLFFYTLLVVYGTLYPFRDWVFPSDFQWEALLPSWPGHLSRADMLTNLVIYLPIGALWVWHRGPPVLRALLSALVFGGCLSTVLESVQVLLPGRVPSLADLLANLAGTLVGGVVAALVAPRAPLGRRATELRRRWFLPGRLTDLGLAALGLWALAQLTPLVPSADLGNLKQGLKPLWHALTGRAAFQPAQAAEYFLAVTGLGLLAATLGRDGRRTSRLFALFVAAVLLAKVPVLTRQLSLEAATGGALGLLAVLAARGQQHRRAGLIAAAALTAAFLAGALRAGGTGGPPARVGLNWVPFGSHRLNLFDLPDLLGELWPSLAAGCAVRGLWDDRPRLPPAMLGGLLWAIAALAVEWAQRTIPGRVPDITDVVLVVAGWLAAWWLPAEGGGRENV